MTLFDLRKKHPEFVYERFLIREEENKIQVKFHFTLRPNITFYPRLEFPKPSKKLESQKLNVFIFHIGLIEILSYWKAACPQVITIKAGFLTEEQIKWWKKLLVNGMGEFFYKNQIDFTSDDFVRFNVKSNNRYDKFTDTRLDRSLVMVGGGRDSVVSLEILKEAGEKMASMMLEPSIAARESGRVAAVSKSAIVTRTLDPTLLKLNSEGYLNGHTPFSAVLAFVGVASAMLHNFRRVVASNEASSNEVNTHYLGHEINHQYSKTYHFEATFRDYMQKFLSPHLEYYSLARPLYELQLSKIFSHYPQYFLKVKSCNVNQKDNSWCCQCPKCLFIYASLYPFLENDKVTEMFGEDLYQNASLYDVAEQLILDSREKPFECVGTKEESLTAFYLSLKKAKQKNRKLPILLQLIQEKIIAKEQNLDDRAQKITSHWNNEHFIPKHIAEILYQKVEL